jgi:hypothetical protein
MNTVTEIAPVISADNDALRRDFPLKPFAIRHKLSGHPLLTLPRIAQLASELPRDLIEYNSGKVAISQDPDAYLRSISIRSRWCGASKPPAHGWCSSAWRIRRNTENYWKTPCSRSPARAV